MNECSEEEVQRFIDSDHWCAQEKYDGVNRLLIKTGNEIVGANRKGLSVAIPKEVEEEMRTLPDCVLSGEAIGDKVMCFDIIPENKEEYRHRYSVLEGLLPTEHIRLVDTSWTTQQKRRLLLTLKNDNKEGIVFKRIDSVYHPGRPNSGGDMLKFKFKATASVIVEGVNKGKRSVSMVMYDVGPVRVGNVTIYPNYTIPEEGSIIEVEYLYAFKGGSLFQPVYLGPRTDLDYSDCNIKQLKYKKEEE